MLWVHGHYKFLILSVWGSTLTCLTGYLTKPRIATNGAHDPNKKIPEPYRTIRIILHFLYESAFRVGSEQEIRTCRLAFEPLPYLTRVLPHHYNFSCHIGRTLRTNLPHLTYAFTMFTYQPYTVARMNYIIFIRTLRSK